MTNHVEPDHHLPAQSLLRGGSYRIVKFLSSGGFGCTYEAEHILLHKRVAIKEFFFQRYCNRDENTYQITVGTLSQKTFVEKMKQKFMNEAVAISQLHHPHIVGVSDIFEENGTAYYVMDYIDGLSLGEMVKQHGPLSEERALRYVRQVADALRYVHSQNRLHLDIKPDNIMIGPQDNAILIDFGASKHYSDSGDQTSTLLGIITPGYAPAEQMSSDFKTFLPSVDIYALGATLYKALTGITPPLAIDLLTGKKQLMPLPASISSATRQAVASAMQGCSIERPQSIDAFLAILDAAPAEASSPKPVRKPVAKPRPKPRPEADDIDVVVVEHGTVSNSTPPTPQKPRRRVQHKTKPEPKPKSWGNVALIVLAVAVLLVGGYFLSQSLLKPSEDDIQEWYENGQSCVDDEEYEEAAEWFQKAAEQGHEEAQLILGQMYDEGVGVDLDHEEAVKWYRKAAEQGNASAQYNLGVAYHKGEGVEEDDDEAVKWLSKASRQGYALAQLDLGFMYLQGYGVEEDEFEAFKWFKLAAEQNLAPAQFNMGLMYENGCGTDQDISEAKRWYRKAADLGDEDAQQALKRLKR